MTITVLVVTGLVMRKIYFLMQVLCVLGCSNGEIQQARAQASEASPAQFISCPNDPQKQLLRSNELQEIVKADHEDRKIPGNQIDWNKVSAADEVRAKRVAEIFAEGCFKSSNDYAAAALVFQHGTVPDHYYQAYLWSKRALDLGDETQKQMVANAIDRYLINLGYKQIFGAQRFRNGPDGCHCLGQTELKFPEKQRMKVCGVSLEQRIISLREENKDNPICEKVLYCETQLKSPPKGMFPGIW
jgi:hypothetical protein